MLHTFRILTFGALLVAVAALPNTPTKSSLVERHSSSSEDILAQSSPAYLSFVPLPDNVITEYPSDDSISVRNLPDVPDMDLSDYPPRGEQPPFDHPEVQKVMDYINWENVPDFDTRVMVDWTLDLSQYDVNSDEACWWSSSNCKRPKVSYLPEDIYYCPNAGDWGLNYDDGPFKLLDRNHPDIDWEQPRFYNSLIRNGHQKATLFFVGANVVSFPDAAQRALSDGHTICSHTWNHPSMTTLTNEQVVAQFYWTQKAIKQVLGITPKCWRPPFGDVDDRIRAIAWQMGMRTILWDQDSNDWNMPGTAGPGHIQPDVVNSYFENWVEKRNSGEDDEHGHITLQHENSNSTIAMAEKWLPKLQEAFNVIPIHQCLNDDSPYWEDSFVYPTLDNQVSRKRSLAHLAYLSQPLETEAGQRANTELRLSLNNATNPFASLSRSPSAPSAPSASVSSASKSQKSTIYS
ncbi:hypothetical protein BDF14DRAFT_1959188 [Spinellus fusiger]|nr:hypothetical protein BDF14DRAFT_1959188 [Spinellus fusiger]